MKSFLTKSIITISLFFILYIVVIEGLFYFASSQTEYMIFRQDWIRIKRRIDDSKNIINSDTLYVGCSVSGQLFPYNESNQLTTNGSTYAIGNYFLIKNAISHNSNINTVIYLSIPDVIGHKLSRERTYNYFVKPFFTLENRAEIMNSKQVSQTLQRNPLNQLSLFNWFKVLQLDDYNYSDNIPKRTDSLSIESMEWLIKIKSLCESNNVRFHLASPPVAKSRLAETQNWAIIKKQTKGTELEELFHFYFKTIQYTDDVHLKDHLHWKHDFIIKNRSEFIRNIKNQLPK